MIIIYGSNNLLVQGANCIINSEDVIRHFKKSKTNISNTLKNKKDTEIINNIKVPNEFKNVYDVLNKKGENIDEICRKLDCDLNEILSKLTMLEMQGYIVQYPGKIFARKI